MRDDAFKAGAIRKPTRSLLLGDPAHGCVIEVDGVDELRNGTTVTASFRSGSRSHPSCTGHVPVWYGHVWAKPGAAPDRGRADITDCRARLSWSMSVFAIGNNKGGPGKTTVTVQLAAASAQGGRRVLVVDLDPQANASRRLGFRWSAADPVIVS